MNHIRGLAIAQSIQRDRLVAASRRRRYPRPVTAPTARRRHVMDAVRAYLMGLRHKPEPTR